MSRVRSRYSALRVEGSRAKLRSMDYWKNLHEGIWDSGSRVPSTSSSVTSPLRRWLRNSFHSGSVTLYCSRRMQLSQIARIFVNRFWRLWRLYGELDRKGTGDVVGLQPQLSYIWCRSPSHHHFCTTETGQPAFPQSLHSLRENAPFDERTIG